jgi:cell wall assembly regulator SMI1
MDSIRKSWKVIERWYRRHATEIELPRASSEAAINDAEQRLGFAFPSDLRASFKVHDGSDGQGILPYGFQLYSVGEIVAEREVWMKLANSKSFATLSPPDVRLVKPVWWNPLWIPISGSGGGDHDIVDTDPDTGGKIGQVLEFSHESGPRIVVAANFDQWLSNLASGLERGDYRYDEDSMSLLPVERY